MISQLNPSGSSYTYNYDEAKGLLNTATTSYGVKLSLPMTAGAVLPVQPTEMVRHLPTLTRMAKTAYKHFVWKRRTTEASRIFSMNTPTETKQAVRSRMPSIR